MPDNNRMILEAVSTATGAVLKDLRLELQAQITAANEKADQAVVRAQDAANQASALKELRETLAKSTNDLYRQIDASVGRAASFAQDAANIANQNLLMAEELLRSTVREFCYADSSED